MTIPAMPCIAATIKHAAADNHLSVENTYIIFRKPISAAQDNEKKGLL
jgi:hypothetical protein